MSEQWGNIFTNPPTADSTGKILVADVHRAQQTDGVKAMLKKKLPNWLIFPQLVLVRFNILMFLLRSHLRALLDKSLRNFSRRISNGILKGKSVPVKEKY